MVSDQEPPPHPHPHLRLMVPVLSSEGSDSLPGFLSPKLLNNSTEDLQAAPMRRRQVRQHHPSSEVQPPPPTGVNPPPPRGSFTVDCVPFSPRTARRRLKPASPHRRDTEGRGTKVVWLHFPSDPTEKGTFVPNGGMGDVRVGSGHPDVNVMTLLLRF